MEQILLAALVGTTLMSIFSYAVSEAFDELYKEPVLLNYVLNLLGAKISKYKSLIGWVIHYITGYIFTLGFYLVWNYTPLQLSWLSGLLLGAVAGIIGIVGWTILFNVPSKSPRGIRYQEYFLQLFFAHIVFGLGVTGVFLYHNFNG